VNVTEDTWGTMTANREKQIQKMGLEELEAEQNAQEIKQK